MKFKKYITLTSKSKDISEFRQAEIALVHKKTRHLESIKKVQKEYKLPDDIEMFLKILNEELRLYYKGEYRFDFCLDKKEEVEDLVISEKCKERIKEKLLSFNNKFSEIKKKFEKELQQNA